MELLVLTGMSGAGKSQAANILEDMGYYCIDNIPVALITKFTELYAQIPEKSPNVAVIIDVRGEIEFHTLFHEIEALRAVGHFCRIVFIDCADNVLVNRYKETRRVHPLVTLKNISMTEALKLERKMLAEVYDKADYIIDTSVLTVHQLREKITAVVKSDSGDIMITCMSFGFKYGIATEADLVFDVRCFPNPFYEKELKDKTGLEKPVRDFVFSYQQTNEFLRKLCEMIDSLLPLYVKEGKSQLVIAIGCTGGKHRSVAIAEALNQHFVSNGKNSLTIHRDIGK